ncbi:MAG: hypothetical protein IJQ11_09050 [Bacteroidales bacterium]|nr:hypothetical protein [Bacteroidales bacterium]
MNKLFKLLALLSMVFAVASCDTIGLLIHTAKLYDGTQSYNCGDDVARDTIHFVVNSRNKMLFKAEINGKTDTVMYDSGVNSFTALMYTPSTKPEGMKFYRHGVSGADKRSKIKVTTLQTKIRTDMVVSEGVGMAMLAPEPPMCSTEHALSEYDIIGFQGINVVRYMLDFSNNIIYEIHDSLTIDTTEFIPIKCKYERNVMWVYPRINGVERECIFDTGNSAAAFLLADKQRVEHPADSDLVYEGSFGMAVGGYTDKQRFVHAQNEALSLAGDDKETQVLYVKSVAHDNMGLAAISQYDWIIANWGQNPKMYVRPHKTDSAKPFKKKPYVLSTADGTLRILTRLINGNERFNVGDQIISVNGEKITEENICHYYDLLKESMDWSGFEIQVK